MEEGGHERARSRATERGVAPSSLFQAGAIAGGGPKLVRGAVERAVVSKRLRWRKWPTPDGWCHRNLTGWCRVNCKKENQMGV